MASAVHGNISVNKKIKQEKDLARQRNPGGYRTAVVHVRLLYTNDD